MHENTISTTSTVTGARHSNTLSVPLSGRPQVTYMKPWYNDPVWADRMYPRVIVGYDTSLIIEGYSLDNTTNIYISAGTGVYTNKLSAVYLFDPFTGTSSLTGKDLHSLYPAFSGFELPTHNWHAENYNLITATLSATQGVGYIDMIILNEAGYSLLSVDLSGSTIVAAT